MKLLRWILRIISSTTALMLYSVGFGFFYGRVWHSQPVVAINNSMSDLVQWTLVVFWFAVCLAFVAGCIGVTKYSLELWEETETVQLEKQCQD